MERIFHAMPVAETPGQNNETKYDGERVLQMTLLAKLGRTFEILLVEDNPTDARLVSLALKGFELDHYLRVVTDGQLAIDFLTRRNSYENAPRPDIILLDWKLPLYDGSDILKVIRQDPFLRDVPVVVVSGMDMGELARNTEGAAADFYVEKPITLDRFSHVLQYLLGALEKKSESVSDDPLDHLPDFDTPK